MAEGSGLENQRTFARTVGSNPTLTAFFRVHRLAQQLSDRMAPEVYLVDSLRCHSVVQLLGRWFGLAPSDATPASDDVTE